MITKKRLILVNKTLLNDYRTQDGLIVPPGWLCYLAPELVRNLRVHQRPEEEDLPFSKASDVYAFG